MITATYYTFGFIFGTSIWLQTDVAQLRQNYLSATRDEAICKIQVERLKNQNLTEPIGMAYKGAYYMLWANYLNTPLDKLNSFKRGKELMEAAIKKRYSDPEIHFLRLTIQQHAPRILKYDKNIQEDIQQITKNWESIPTTTLKKQIKDFLESNKLLNNTQLSKLHT